MRRPVALSLRSSSWSGRFRSVAANLRRKLAKGCRERGPGLVVACQSTNRMPADVFAFDAPSFEYRSRWLAVAPAAHARPGLALARRTRERVGKGCRGGGRGRAGKGCRGVRGVERGAGVFGGGKLTPGRPPSASTLGPWPHGPSGARCEAPTAADGRTETGRPGAVGSLGAPACASARTRPSAPGPAPG